MNKIILSLAVAGLFTTTSLAQNLMTLKYPIAFTTGDLNEYVEKVSWRGIGFGYRYLADGDIAAGFDLGFQGFYERKDYDTYTVGTASLSGVQYRYQWNTTMTGQVEYILNEGQDFRPFIGIGAGAIYNKRITDFGLYRFTQDPWQFLMKPEIGVSYYMSNGTALLISGEYFAAFDTQDLEGQSFVTLNIGLIFSTD